MALYRAAGVNNNFLIATRDPLALTYNDSSVLENRHIACLYTLVSAVPDANVFSNIPFDSALWKDIRKMIISAILHTDMVHHFPIVSKVRAFSQPPPTFIPCRRGEGFS